MNDYDFGSLTSAASDAKPTNPIEVFQSVPSLDGTPNDLWSGQSSALEQWHDDRDKKDVLVSLHTGAGKSLVGLIIAQSLVNEGVPNVIYACATNDLVLQTEKEVSSRLSFLCSTRAGGRFSNDNFENGTGFCITNYQALFNSRTKFRGDMRPGAIIFDDAHVADKIIRDCYTISISRRDLAAAFDEFIALITPYFQTMLRGEFLNAIVQGVAERLLRVYRSIRGLVIIIITRRLDMADIACQKIRSSCWPITTTSLKISFGRL